VPKPQDLVGLPDGLSPLRLRPACDPKTLGFETTASLKPRVGFIGQDRAIDSIKLPAEIAHKGFPPHSHGAQWGTVVEGQI